MKRTFWRVCLTIKEVKEDTSNTSKPQTVTTLGGLTAEAELPTLLKSVEVFESLKGHLDQLAEGVNEPNGVVKCSTGFDPLKAVIEAPKG